jgi:hypothetical protein
MQTSGPRVAGVGDGFGRRETSMWIGLLTRAMLGVVSAPLYDSTTFRFAGMFTLTECVLRFALPQFTKGMEGWTR